MSKLNRPTPVHDPIAANLSPADDRILLSQWLPPQAGIVPRIRLGMRWYNVLWALPIAFVLLVAGVAIAQALRELPSVQAFLQRYPGAPASVAAVASGFPLWLRVQHFLNLLFMAFIIRAGVQILADHPRLYWHRDCTPGTDWFRFQKPVPPGRIWTAKDDSVTIPGWLGIPGIRHSIGPARWWHFSVNLLWTINGVAFYVLLFSTDQWRRLVPTTWAVIPNAASTALQYFSLTCPATIILSGRIASARNAPERTGCCLTWMLPSPRHIVNRAPKDPAFLFDRGACFPAPTWRRRSRGAQRRGREERSHPEPRAARSFARAWRGWRAPDLPRSEHRGILRTSRTIRAPPLH